MTEQATNITKPLFLHPYNVDEMLPNRQDQWDTAGNTKQL